MSLCGCCGCEIDDGFPMTENFLSYDSCEEEVNYYDQGR